MRRVYELALLALLLLSGARGAAGQALSGDDRRLADGQPPLTGTMVNHLVELFEWTLEARFDARERAEFERQRVAEWRSSDRQGIEHAVGFLKIYDQLAALPAETRAGLRPQLQRTLVEALRGQPNDNTSRLLLEVYETAHTQAGAAGNPAGGETAPDDEDGGEARRAGAPAELVGTWQAGSSSATSYVNPATGATSDPSGTQVMYTIFADGRYEYAALTQQSFYNCTTKLLTFKTGVVRFAAGALIFVPREGKFTSQDSCNRQYNYEKPATLERESYRWRVERDQYGTKLCLQNEKVNGCAYKSK